MLEICRHLITVPGVANPSGVNGQRRTNQQSMFRHIIVHAIRLMGQPDFGTDDRNRVAHQLAARLLEVIEAEGAYLPMI